MPTPPAKKPAKKTVPAEVTEEKKPKKAAAVKAEAAPKVKKTPGKKARPEEPQVTPLFNEPDPPQPVAQKPARGRKPKQDAEAHRLQDGPAGAAPRTSSVRAAAAKNEATPDAPTALMAPVETLIAAPPKAAAGLPAHGETVLTALREGRPLEFIFLDGDANPPRTFEPRQLIFDTLAQAWFVWGWDRRYNAERHHRLDALAEVNQVEGMGRSAQGPFKEGTSANLLGGWLGGEPIPVKVTLMKQWIFAVKQAPPAFPQFRIMDAEDGKATVTFTATDLRAIARWCMQFGDGIQVLEPQRLIDRIKQAGLTWAGKPAGAAPASPSAKPAHRPETPTGASARHDREEAKREPLREAEGRVGAGSGGGRDKGEEGHRPQAGPKGGAHERHRETRSESHAAHAGPKGGGHEGDTKPGKGHGKIEVRVERL